MRSFVAIILASMCLFAHATSVYQTPAFLELKKKPFTLALSNMIQVNMGVTSTQATGRLDAINQALDQVAQSLQDQLTTVQNEQGALQVSHQNLVDQLTSQLNQANHDIENQSNEQSDLKTQQQNDEAALSTEEASLAANQVSLAAAQSSQVAEENRNNQAVQEFADAIAACQQSILLLNSLASGQASFIQAKAKFTNVVALLQKHLSKSASPLVTPVITVLSELATSAKEVNQVQLNNIVNLINQLLDELRNQQAQNVVNHNQTVSDLANQVDNLNGLISQNNVNINNLNTRLEAAAERLSQLASSLATLNALVPVVQGQIDTENQSFANASNALNQEAGQIQADQSGLQQVRDYFNQNVVTSVQNVDDDVYNDSLSAPAL